jgi:target of rapamycin complex 2 subunit MAPKAP1
MYMQEVLEMVCKRRKMDNPGDYALILRKILVPLDRTVASLQGEMDLELVKKTMLAGLGIDPGTRTTRTTDPNGELLLIIPR